jgi:hypothetical protein
MKVRMTYTNRLGKKNEKIIIIYVKTIGYQDDDSKVWAVLRMNLFPSVAK